MSEATPAAKRQRKSYYLDADGILSEFDRKRPIRQLLPEDQTVVASMKEINQELLCPVCLSVMKECCTTTKCIHRFCYGCMCDWLRVGNRQCPTCRAPCPSRRNLRRDHELDALIACIYPDIDSARDQQDQDTNNILQSEDHKEYSESVQKAIDRQKTLRTRRYVRRSLSNTTSSSSSHTSHAHPSAAPASSPRASPPPPSTSTSSSSSSSSSSADATEPEKKKHKPGPPTADEIVFYLIPSQTCPPHRRIAKTHLRTSKSVTIAQLNKYLAVKLQLDASCFRFSLNPKSEGGSDAPYVPPNSESLGHIAEHHWKDAKTPLTLKYAVIEPKK